MGERSFNEGGAVASLRAGQVFEGEGILAVTKALLHRQASRNVGGYQGPDPI